MRIRSVVLGGTGSRRLWNLGFSGGVGGVVSAVQQIAGIDHGLAAVEVGSFFDSINFSASHQTDGSGTTSFVRRVFLLLYRPILPGDIDNVSMDMRISIQGTYPSPATGKVKLIAMRSPATWDPFAMTFNTKPTVDSTDPTISKTLAVNASSVFTEDEFKYHLNWMFDWSKITDPIYGFALEAQLDSGVVGATLSIGTENWVFGSSASSAFWTKKVSKAEPVIAREALLVDGQSIRRLYLTTGAVGNRWNTTPYLPVFGGSTTQLSLPAWVQDVGVGRVTDGTNHYDSDLVAGQENTVGPGTITYATVLPWSVANDTLDIINNDPTAGFTEPKTMCAGSVYFDL